MKTRKGTIGTKLVATALLAATSFVALFPAGCVTTEETAEQEAFGVVANYDNEIETRQNAVLSASKTDYITGHASTSGNAWLEEFGGASGVMKVTADNVNGEGAGYLQIKLPEYKAEEMLENDFGYITVKLYVETDARFKKRLNDYYAGEFDLLPTAEKSGDHTDLPIGKWTTITINRSEFAGADEAELKKSLTEDGLTLYTDQIRWKKGGALAYEYAYVLKDTAGDYRIIDKNTGWQATSIAYYVDEITWSKDDSKPTVSMLSNATVLVNTEYTPEFSVVDAIDASPTVDSVTITKTGETTALPLTNGKITFTQTGSYTSKVVAKDKAGNTAERSFELNVVSELDKHILTDYGGMSADVYLKEYVSPYSADSRYYDEPSVGGAEWLSEYAGAKGVSKVVVDNADENGAGFFALQLTEEQLDTMFANNFEYIQIRILLEIDESVRQDFVDEGDISLYGAAAGNTVKVGQWTTITIQRTKFDANNVEANIRSRLLKGTSMSYLNSMKWCVTKDNKNPKYDHLVLFNQSNNVNFHVNGKETAHKASVVTYYVDEIRWG